MPITISQLTGQPIVLATLEQPMELRQEVPAMFQDLIALTQSLDGYPWLYIVVDATKAGAFSFGDIVYILSESRVTIPHRRADMAVRLMLIGSGMLLDLAAKAMSQLQYGGYQMRLFPTLDQALETAQDELAEQAAA
jgi:hypothetical protein